MRNKNIVLATRSHGLIHAQLLGVEVTEAGMQTRGQIIRVIPSDERRPGKAPVEIVSTTMPMASRRLGRRWINTVDLVGLS